MLDPENEKLRNIYKNKNIGKAPEPWKEVLYDISGITAVGFGPGTEYLLILTHSGLGVFD